MLEVFSQIYGPYKKEADEVLELGQGIWWTGPKRIAQPTLGQLSKMSCIFGHISYGPHPDISCQYITALRNPVDRVVSNFYYKRRMEGGGFEPFERMGFDKNTTLYEYLKSGKDLSIHNAQTAQLAGIPLDNTFNPMIKPDFEDFQIARERMGKMLVGVLEHFDETLAYFTRELGWPHTPKSAHENRGDHPDPRNEDPKAISLILEYNQFDLILWDLAKEKLLVS